MPHGKCSLLDIKLICFILKDQQTLNIDVESKKERCARDAKWHFYIEAYRHVRNSKHISGASLVVGYSREGRSEK